MLTNRSLCGSLLNCSGPQHVVKNYEQKNAVLKHLDATPPSPMKKLKGNERKRKTFGQYKKLGSMRMT
jgi:hypothetical protein